MNVVTMLSIRTLRTWVGNQIRENPWCFGAASGLRLALEPMDSVARPRNGRRRPAKVFALALSLVLAGVSAARAQQTPSESNGPQSHGRFSVRLGKDSTDVPPITTKARFRMGAERSGGGGG